MRRKAEILKYAGNKQSTKQNSFTKKELYKNAMMGNNRRSSRVLDCPWTRLENYYREKVGKPTIKTFIGHHLKKIKKK